MVLLAWWSLGLDAGARVCPHHSFPCPSQALSFTYLILATGSTGLFPGKFNQVSSQQMAIQAYEDMVTQVSCLLPGGRTVRAEPGVGGPGRVGQLWGWPGLQQGAPGAAVVL